MRLLPGTPRFRRLAGMLLLAGFLLRLVVIAFTDGGEPDVLVLAMMAQRIVETPLDAYVPTPSGSTPPWPYPPGYLPFLGAAHLLTEITGVSAIRTTRLPPAVADIGLAVLANAFLAHRGSSERHRLVAIGLLTFGPCMPAVSAVHGQFDSVAMLPALGAVVLWDRSPPGTRRAILVGALIGLGAAIKGAPLLLLLAVLPSVAGRREAVMVAGTAIATLMAIWTPWLVADAEDALAGLRQYRGIPGRAGLMVLVQPELAQLQLSGRVSQLSTPAKFLQDNTTAVLLVTLSAIALRLAWIRAAAPGAAVAVIAAFLVFSPAVSPQYWVWIVAVLAVTGRLWQAAVLQVILLAPLVAIYRPVAFPDASPRLLDRDLVAYGYFPLIVAATIFMTAVLVRELRATPRVRR